MSMVHIPELMYQHGHPVPYQRAHTLNFADHDDASDDWDGTRSGSTDNGPALQDVLDNAAANAPTDGYVSVIIPHTPRGWYFATGVQVPSNVYVVVAGLVINDAQQPSGLDVAIENKNFLFALNDVESCAVVGPDGGLARIRAIAEGDFTGGRNPQVAVALAGTIDNVQVRAWCTDHQNFAIMYGDTDTDPATAYFDNVSIAALIDGDTGPAGDGSGVNMFCRSQDGDVPAARNLHLILFADITRGSTDKNEHGPQGVKINNTDGVTGRTECYGGSVAGTIATNGCRNVNLTESRNYAGTRGFQVSGGNNTATTRTQSIHVGKVTYDPLDTTNADEFGLVVGEVEGFTAAVDLDGAIAYVDDGEGYPCRSHHITGTVRGVFQLRDASAARDPITASSYDLTLIGGAGSTDGRATLSASNWQFDGCRFNLALVESGGSFGVFIGGDRNRFDVTGVDVNPDDNADWELCRDGGVGNVWGTLALVGAHNVDWHYMRSVAGEYNLVGPLVGTAVTAPTNITGGTPGDLTFFGSDPAGQQTAPNGLTDNTGGATDDTVAAVSGSGDDATINNNLAELAEDIDQLRTALVNLGLIA